MLEGNETVTLVKLRDGASYERSVFEGVSWFERKGVKAEGRGVTGDDLARLRIPAEALDGQALPAPGDHVVRGRIPETAVIGTPEELARYGPRKVLEVRDDRRGGLPHVAVTAR